VGQELLLSDGTFSLLEDSTKILAAIPTFLVALLTRSLLGTVVTGILSMLLLRMVY
jgi:branched-subunit amino acid transport protein